MLAEGAAIKTASLPPSLLALPCRRGIFHMLGQHSSISETSKRRVGPVQYTSNMGTPRRLVANLYHPRASQTRRAQGRESNFHTVYPFLEFYGQENLSQVRAAGGKKHLGIQLCNIQRRADLFCLPAHIISTYINFWQGPSAFPTPGWDSLAQENSQSKVKRQ